MIQIFPAKIQICPRHELIKRYRIAFCDALFIVCDATSIMYSKLCYAKIIKPLTVKLANGAVPDSQIEFVFNIAPNLDHCPFRDSAILVKSQNARFGMNDPESRLALSFSLINLTAPLQPYELCKRSLPSNGNRGPDGNRGPLH